MAAFMVARQSARAAKQTLFYVQAVDAPAKLPVSAMLSKDDKDRAKKEFFKDLLRLHANQTKKLPSYVLFHVDLRMRFATTVQAPYAVQDVECTVLGFQKHADEESDWKQHMYHPSGTPGEYAFKYLPVAIYVKIDKCDHVFLPDRPCKRHLHTGKDTACVACTSAGQPGIFAVKPRKATFQYKDATKFHGYLNVARLSFPLMPADAMALYSLQGTTADPGMVAYWEMPQRASKELKWLIVYVMLSRPRSLSSLRSVGMGPHIKDIIEQGPPEEFVQSFDVLFGKKMEKTKKIAREAAIKYGFLPESF